LDYFHNYNCWGVVAKW